jgi:hypothetical protein
MHAVSRNAQSPKVQRLAVNLAIHVLTEKFAELTGFEIRGREDGLIEVLAGSCKIVVVGEYVHLTVQRCYAYEHRERECAKKMDDLQRWTPWHLGLL